MCETYTGGGRENPDRRVDQTEDPGGRALREKGERTLLVQGDERVGVKDEGPGEETRGERTH